MNWSRHRWKELGGSTARVVRGGSWNNNERVNLRSANRNNDDPRNRNDNNGFRVVLVGGGGKARQSLRELDRSRVGKGPARSEPKKTRSLTRLAPPWRKTAAALLARAGCRGKDAALTRGPLNEDHGLLLAMEERCQALAMRPISSSLEVTKKSWRVWGGLFAGGGIWGRLRIDD